MRIDWKAKYATSPSLPYENIALNDKVCWLLNIFQDQSSGCRCSIGFFKNSIQFNIYCHLNHKTDLWQNKDKHIQQAKEKPKQPHMHNVLWVPCPQFKRLFNEGTEFSYLYRWWWTKNIFNLFTFFNVRLILKYKWKIFISKINIFIRNEKKMVFIFNLIAYLTQYFFPGYF